MVAVIEGRFEMKYSLPLERRAEVLDFAQQFIGPDENAGQMSALLPEVCAAGGTTPRGYRVSSLYFDDANLSGYARRIDGRRIRNRVRIRTYGTTGGDSFPVFLEAKRKLYRQVVKHRVRVTTTDGWKKLPEESPWEHVEVPEDSMNRDRWERWCAAVRAQALRPVCRVEYLRETFAHGRLRLTLDHRVHAVASRDPMDLRGLCSQRLIPAGWVVLELKYNGQPPPWMRRLVSRFGLVAEPISKFALGVARTCRQGHRTDQRATTPPSILRTVDHRAAK
ncbi:MAG TPA: hypothetical protein DFR83_13190 [Deltaproteobacteria bacterium]|nr:hypothetical protein [Deltaproteobacteria bacterium]